MELYQLLHTAFVKSCSNIDSLWQKRKRTIDTKLIVLFLMKIISGKNNHGYSYIINEIWDDCNRENISLPQCKPVSASSMCEARMKLPDDTIKNINKDMKTIRLMRKRNLCTHLMLKKHIGRQKRINDDRSRKYL